MNHAAWRKASRRNHAALRIAALAVYSPGCPPRHGRFSTGLTMDGFPGTQGDWQPTPG
jgi:hypothetical protein